MNLEDFEGKTLYVKVEKRKKGKIGNARELRNAVVVPLGRFQLLVRGYGQKRRVVSFYAPLEVIKHIREKAQEEGLNFSLFVRRILFREGLSPVPVRMFYRGKKQRASISLSDDDYRRLKELSHKHGKSLSSFISSILSAHYLGTTD